MSSERVSLNSEIEEVQKLVSVFQQMKEHGILLLLEEKESELHLVMSYPYWEQMGNGLITELFRILNYDRAHIAYYKNLSPFNISDKGDGVLIACYLSEAQNVEATDEDSVVTSSGILVDFNKEEVS